MGKELFNQVSNKVGLKEDVAYHELLNKDDRWGESLGYLARRNFKRFVAVLDDVIEEKNYDVILGAGNTGIAMATITKMVYEQLGESVPPIIKLPIVRFSYTKMTSFDTPLNRFDNSVLCDGIRDQVESIGSIQNVLFVDDEIGNGITAREAVKVLFKAAEIEPQNVKVAVIAEDQGFKEGEFLEGVSSSFYPFADEIEGMNNIVTFIVPWEMEQKIKECLGTDDIPNCKEAMNLLLGLPIKETYKVNGMDLPKATFRYDLLEKAEAKIPGFKNMKIEFQQIVTKLITEALSENKK